jgi:hypothetical protein
MISAPSFVDSSRGKPLLEGDFARGKIVDGADHTNLILGDHLGGLRVLQALSVVWRIPSRSR